MTSAAFALLLGVLAGALAPTQAPPASPAGDLSAPEGPVTAPVEVEGVAGPTPGAPTISLGAAVHLALRSNFGLLDAADALTGARWQERAAEAQFLPRVTPLYQRSDQRSAFGLDLAQTLPWLGASVTASGRYLSESSRDALFPRTTDLRVLFTQPLLRGFGPNASLFGLRNARRASVGQQRAVALARQGVAISVAAAFYGVIAQRQLLEVASQSLSRTETLLRSSTARLEVGMASKLDVFRAELQASQARDGMVRAEAALASALERFRGLLAVPPGDPLEPEAAALPRPDEALAEPLAALVRRAVETRLELAEARDSVEDARRASSLASQNLLPQLDVNVSLTQAGVGGTFGDAWRAGGRRVDVFLSTSYPLQQGDARASRALAELQLGSRQRGVAQRELEVEQQVRQSLRDLEQIGKSVELQRSAVEIASQQRRLAVLRYERGLGSNFDVVDAEGSLVATRSALVQLIASWAVARLELKRATGSLDLETEFTP